MKNAAFETGSVAPRREAFVVRRHVVASHHQLSDHHALCLSHGRGTRARRGAGGWMEGWRDGGMDVRRRVAAAAAPI